MFLNYNAYPFLFPFQPFLPLNCEKPPTLYSILNSIVNGDKEIEDYSKINDLAKLGRETIFNFDYPLSENVSREKFETMILNKFLMRRIGYETVTAFRIALNVKLNEIMPLYNKMFDSIENWDILNDGEKTIKTGKDNRLSENNSSAQNMIETDSHTETNSTSDRRNSELPQNELEDLQDGSYVTTYNFDTDGANSTDTSRSSGNSTAKNTNNDISTYEETITRSPSDKISILKEIQENINNVYTLIFKELDCLFYQLI